MGPNKLEIECKVILSDGELKKKKRKVNSSCFFFPRKRYMTRRSPLKKPWDISGIHQKRVQNLFGDGFTQMTKSVEQLAGICKDGLDSFNIEKFLLPIVTHRNRIRGFGFRHHPFKFNKNKRPLGHFMEKSLFAEKRQNNFLASRKQGLE